MPTNKPFPKENKKYIMEKSDKVRLCRKTGLFVPIREWKQEIKQERLEIGIEAQE